MGRRPALVLTPAIYNSRSGLAVVCPITARVKGYPFEARIPEGYPVTGVVLADHIRSVNWRERNAEYLCRLAQTLVDEVLDLVDVLFEGDH